MKKMEFRVRSMSSQSVTSHIMLAFLKQIINVGVSLLLLVYNNPTTMPCIYENSLGTHSFCSLENHWNIIKDIVIRQASYLNIRKMII